MLLCVVTAAPAFQSSRHHAHIRTSVQEQQQSGEWHPATVAARRRIDLISLTLVNHAQGAAVFPIFQSATYEHDPTTALGYDDVKYARCNNTPAHESLNAKLAALHGAEAAMITGSGMAAITTTLLSFVKARALMYPARAGHRDTSRCAA